MELLNLGKQPLKAKAEKKWQNKKFFSKNWSFLKLSNNNWIDINPYSHRFVTGSNITSNVKSGNRPRREEQDLLSDCPTLSSRDKCSCVSWGVKDVILHQNADFIHSNQFCAIFFNTAITVIVVYTVSSVYFILGLNYGKLLYESSCKKPFYR